MIKIKVIVMTEHTIIDTGINTDTHIIANRYNADDNIAILKQGNSSLKYLRLYFEQKEHPDKFKEDPTAPLKTVVIDTSYSINSINFFVKLSVLILIMIIVWDYLKTE